MHIKTSPPELDTSLGSPCLVFFLGGEGGGYGVRKADGQMGLRVIVAHMRFSPWYIPEISLHGPADQREVRRTSNGHFYLDLAHN